MTFRATLDAVTLLDDAEVGGETVTSAIRDASVSATVSRGAGSGPAASGAAVDATWTRIDGEKGHTDFVKVLIRGRNGKSSGGNSPTLGIIGRLGGIGARPEMVGLVSDGDGAVSARSAFSGTGKSSGYRVDNSRRI